MTIEQAVYKYSKLRAIPPELIFAIIKNESEFDEKARGSSGEYGLMQLMPGTAKQVGWNEKDDLTDIDRNINYGTKYIAWLRDSKGIKDTRDLLSAYNAGPGNLKHPYINPGYVSRVYGYYMTLSGLNDLSFALPFTIGIVALSLFMEKFERKVKA